MNSNKFQLFIIILSTSMVVASLTVVILFIVLSTDNIQLVSNSNFYPESTYFPKSSSPVLTPTYTTNNISDSPPHSTPLPIYQQPDLQVTPSNSYKSKEKRNSNSIKNIRIENYLSDVQYLKSTLPKNKKYIALSFDDGPLAKTTPKILNELKKRNVIATFCVVGIQINDYPNILKNTVANGNEISNHTYNHKVWKQLTSKQVNDEIDKTNILIKQISGYDCKTVRPPYGIYTKQTLEFVKFPLLLWSVDPEDWKYRNSETIIKNVVSIAKDGDIIILHDIHQSTADAIGPIIDILTDKGFAFVSVSQMVVSGRYRNGSIK